MNKIFNWTFGSFFRTLGRFAFYILIGLILSFLIQGIKLPKINIWQVLDVYAADSGLWIQDTLHIEEADFYNWSSATSYSHITTHQDDYYFYTNQSIQNSVGDILDYRQIYFTNNMNLGSNGVSFVVKMPSQLTSNVLYNVNLYMCTKNVAPSSYSVGIRAGSSYTNSLTAGYNYSSLTRISIGSAGFVDSSASTTWPNCYLYSGFIDTKQSGAYVNFRLTGNANGEHSLIGITYQTVGLTNGLTSQDVSNVISNSGLASASSVSQVQSSVNQVQQELEDVNGSIEEQTQQQQENHEETINTITDTTAPSLDSLNNSAGWLPAGPVDSILNLPLSLLNNLTTNLSKSCSAVVLPLPYVNRNIELPCLNTIYSQIDGLSVWINSIGVIASAFILFGYLINLYKYIDDTLTFRENNYIDNWSGV